MKPYNYIKKGMLNKMDYRKSINFFSPKLSARITSALLALFITVGGIKCFEVIKNGEQKELKDPGDGTGTGNEADTDNTEGSETKKLFSFDEMITVSSAFSAQSMIMCDLGALKAVVSKDMDIRLSPGDMTSVMCAIIVSEAVRSGRLSLYDRIVCPAAAAKRPNYSMSSEVFSVGMRLEALELLKCMIYQKGSSFAFAFSVHISGSEEEFVNEMNNKAKALGMENTLFTNVCGEDDGKAQISAYDAAVMMKYFLDDELLRGIFCSSEPVKIKKYEQSSSVYLTVSNDFFENTCTDSQAKADGILGGKTGICGYSQWTAVLFTNGKTEYMVIALNSPSPYPDVLRMYAAYSQ